MVAMLTTIDNPYDPFTQWNEWLAFDEQTGHHTCEYLGRVVKDGEDLSDDERDRAVEDAIDEIIRVNGLGLYKKVYENDEFYKNKRE